MPIMTNRVYLDDSTHPRSHGLSSHKGTRLDSTMTSTFSISSYRLDVFMTAFDNNDKRLVRSVAFDIVMKFI